MNYYTTKDEAVKLANIVGDDTADMSYIDGEPTLKPYTKAMIYIELMEIVDEVNVKLFDITPSDAIRVLTASMVMVIKAYGIKEHHEDLINLVSSLLRKGLKDVAE